MQVVPLVKLVEADCVYRDALHACSRHTSEGSRSACFVSFGLDSSRVDAYYTIVEDLEECFQKGD